RLTPEIELEPLQPFGDRSLQTLQFRRILVGAVVVEHPQTLQDFVELLRVDLLSGEETPKLLRIVHVLARLAAELTDVCGRVDVWTDPAIAIAPAIAPRSAERVAVAEAAVLSAIAGIAASLAALLSLLALLTGLALLTLLALLTRLTLLALLALLPL